MDVKEFTIDRERWLRGTGQGELLNSEGKMCCLGFLGLACGYRPDEISAVGDPSEFQEIRGDRILWPLSIAIPVTDGYNGAGQLVHAAHTTDVCNEIIGVNDSLVGDYVASADNPSEPRQLVILQDEAERERRLTELFARAGIAVRFV